MSYYNYPPYVSVAQKKAKAARKLKQLKKKNPDIKPIMIEGKTIAKSWWGKSWNVNLERYADYSNRIGRGRSYVRHGAVLDLKIDNGKVNSLVQGSGSRPYAVEIEIKSIEKANWKKIKDQCEGELDSLQGLLAGKFPRELSDIFMARKHGLFPSPKEIAFSCSCPDWADMCKHVAATLYGIGARLDEDPSLFFKLRNVEIKELISKAVEGKTQKLLDKAKKKSSKVIDNADLSVVFGIEMEQDVDFGKKRKAPSPKPDQATPAKKRKTSSVGRKVKTTTGQGRKSTSQTAAKPPIQKSVRRKASKLLKKNGGENAVKSMKTAPETATDLVAGLISKSRKGIGIKELKKKTGFEETKIYGIVHRLKKQARIKNKTHGIYMKA